MSASSARKRVRARHVATTTVLALLAAAGVAILTYPSMAAWFHDLSQSKVVGSYSEQVEQTSPEAAKQLAAAQRYNEALSSGVVVGSNMNVPQGAGASEDPSLDYWKMLTTETGVMARVQIESISLDLPVYHGTSEETLLEGAGHLQGTSLPVGGKGTRSVLTAHRGLPDATMFTNLDKVKKGDRIVITVMDRVLTYEIRKIQVVDPKDTETLRAVEGEDMVTLITCTPLGINSHRILVTGYRVAPVSDADRALADGEPISLGFPWWAAGAAAGFAAIGWYAWWMLRAPRKTRGRQEEDATDQAEPSATNDQASTAWPRKTR